MTRLAGARTREAAEGATRGLRLLVEQSRHARQSVKSVIDGEDELKSLQTR